MILVIKCPNCHEELKLTFKDNKVIRVDANHQVAITHQEISNILRQYNIELG